MMSLPIERVFLILPMILWIFCSEARARELAVMQDKSARVTISDTFRCTTATTLTLTASDASFFDRRLQEMGALFAAGLNNAFVTCNKLSTVRMVGKVNSVTVLKGKSEAQDAWTLRLEVPELQKDANQLGRRVTGYGDLKKLRSPLVRFEKVPGIKETTWYSDYFQKAQAVLNAFVLRGIGDFDSHANALLEKKGNPTAAMRPVLDAFGSYRPDLLPVLQSRFETLKKQAATAKWVTLLETALTSDSTITKVADRLRDQQGTPPLGSDAKVVVWLSEQVEAHESTYPGTSLEELKAHTDFLAELKEAEFGDEWPETKIYRADALAWYTDFVAILLEEAEADAHQLILETGTDPTELDAVFEVGSGLADKFEVAGFSAQAQSIMQASADRIDDLLNAGMRDLQLELRNTEPSRAGLQDLKDRVEVYASLSHDFPQFNEYADISETAASDWAQKLCWSETVEAAGERHRDHVLEFKSSSLPLEELSCQLLTNGHKLSNFSVSWSGNEATLEIEVVGTGTTSAELVATKSADGIRFSDTPDGNSKQWEARLAELIIRPPTGLPDHNGHTECDILAGDPNDKAISVGTDLSTVPANYDFERAIDACIAAAEVTPDDPRPIFQLARVLEAVGETDSARDYFTTASSAGYPPAQHALAMAKLTHDEGDDAFFDAIDLFTASSSAGYAPAKEELATLIPPGAEIWREIPPPTDTEIMNTVKRKVCEGLGGFGACAVRTGVHRKECMQVSADAFSCELVLRMRCEVRMGSDPVMRFLSGLTEASCPSRTDPMFLKFTKSGSRWTARKEF